MLRSGIVGLPNVGKSTLFNAISEGNKAQASNYRFCTIDPNVGLVNVPDERLERLRALVTPERVVPTQLEIVDIAGLVKGASKGEGLGNRFLANIREVDAIIHVVRCFEDENVLREEGKINPVADKEIIDTELQLKDLETIEKRMLKAEKQAKSGDKEAEKEWECLQLALACLSKGSNLRSLDSETLQVLKDNFFLTAKPVLYVANVDENSMHTGNTYSQQLVGMAATEGAEVILMCNALEAQIAEIDNVEERNAFMQMYSMTSPALHKLIQSTYTLLKLQTYFTAGVKEVRAWTIAKGYKAPQAAGVIHSDFEKGFIKAEVIAFDDFMQYKSEAACRDNGKLRIEGKNYEMQDGDVVHFRFNV